MIDKHIIYTMEILKKLRKDQIKVKCEICDIERVVDCLPLMTYGLKLSLEAWILKFKKKIIQ